MRSIAKVLVELLRSSQELPKSALTTLCKFAREGCNDEIRANCVGALGCIGQMSAHFNLNYVISIYAFGACLIVLFCQVIGSVLLEVLDHFKQGKPEVTIEVNCLLPHCPALDGSVGGRRVSKCAD